MRIGVLVCITAFAVAPLSLHAHESGASFEQKAGGYTVDVGYDAERFVAGERVVFDLELLDGSGAPVRYERAWVRIQEGERVVLATGIAEAPVGKTTLLYRFSDAAPSEGSISVRFEGKNAPLAEASFPFSIEKNPSAPPSTPLVAGVTALSALIFGVAAGRLLFARREVAV